MEAAEMDLYYTMGMAMWSGLQEVWPRIHHAREFLHHVLIERITTDLKFCLTEHIDQHVWKHTYYNLIEQLKAHMVANPENKEYYVKTFLGLVEEVRIEIVQFIG